MNDIYSSSAKRRIEEHEQRRLSIMKAAEAQFFAKGYDSVTMGGIARETRLSTGTLYLYFKSKDDLYFAIVMEGARLLNDAMDRAEAGTDTGYGKVIAIGKAFYQFYIDHPEYCEAFLFAGVVWQKAGAQILSDGLALSLRHNFELLHRSILLGMKDGSIRPDVDALKSTVLLVQSLQSIMTLPPGLKTMLVSGGTSHEELVMWAIDTLGKTIMKGD